MRVLLILLLYASSAFSNVLVITSPLQNQNKLYRFELQSIFTLNNVSWDDGTPIIPIFLQFSSETHKRFITDVLLVNSHSFRRDIESKLIKDERDLRNRIVVHGNSGIYSEAKSSTSYDPLTGTSYVILPSGFYKTAALVWSILDSQSTADKAASYNLDLLNRLGVRVQLSIIGRPSLHARSVITLTDSYLGISSKDFYIFALEHNWDRGGFVTSMELTI